MIWPLPDFRFGLTDRSGGRSLAARAEAGDFLFELPGKRNVFRHHGGTGLGGDQFLLLEIEDVAGVLAGLDQFIDELRGLRVLEGCRGLGEAPRGRIEAVPDRRQQIGGRKIGCFDQDAQNEVGFGAQIQDRLQRRQFVVGERGERLLNDFQILVVRRRLQAHRQREPGVIGHRRQFFGELLMGFAKAGDQRAAGGGDGLAFGDRLHQAVQICEDAIGGLVETCGILGGERADGLLEFLTGGGQRLEGIARARPRRWRRAGGQLRLRLPPPRGPLWKRA